MKYLVVRNFNGDDIFAAWSKLRETCKKAAGQPVQAPTKHRTVVNLAEEVVKEVSETEKNGGIHLLVPATELGLVRARLDCKVGDDRPVATRLESLEDMVKGVVEKLARKETNQARAVRIQQPQPTVQPQVIAAPNKLFTKYLEEMCSFSQKMFNNTTLTGISIGMRRKNVLFVRNLFNGKNSLILV